MSLLWVLGGSGGSSPLHRRGPSGPGAEVHLVAGGGSNSSGDLWYHCLLLQGGPGSFRQKGMPIPRVRKRRSSSSISSFSSSLGFFSASHICQIPGHPTGRKRISGPCRDASYLRSRAPATVEKTRSAPSPAPNPSFGVWAEPGLGADSLLIALVS